MYISSTAILPHTGDSVTLTVDTKRPEKLVRNRASSVQTAK